MGQGWTKFEPMVGAGLIDGQFVINALKLTSYVGRRGSVRARIGDGNKDKYP